MKNVLIDEIQNCAKTTRRNANARRSAVARFARRAGGDPRQLRRPLQRQQRADDHAHQDMNQRAPEIPAGQRQGARVRTQPFDQCPLQRIGVLRYVGEPFGRQVRAGVLDDLRHLLHEDRQAFATVAQERGERDASGDQRGDDDGGDQRHCEQARSVAAETAQAQPRRQQR